MLGSACTPERIQALAAIAQCANLVDELAVSGSTDEQILRYCLEGFLIRNSEQVSHFFEDQKNTIQGLRRLLQMLGKQADEPAARQLRYSVHMIHLSKEMRKRSDMLSVIAAGVDRIEAQRSQLSDSEMVTVIGELYQQTISKLRFRIQVQGQHGYLRQAHTATAIRGILFCGIRFGHLWWQEGGSQLDFLFRKTQIKNIAQQLSTSQ